MAGSHSGTCHFVYIGIRLIDYFITNYQLFSLCWRETLTSPLFTMSKVTYLMNIFFPFFMYIPFLGYRTR